MNPSLDPTNQMDSMVYRMGQEERAQIAVQTSFGPLPESAFVASARESIPQASIRLTTATSRGRGGMRGRGRGRSTSQTPIAPGRGNKRGKKRASESSQEAPGNSHAQQAPGNSHAQQAPGNSHAQRATGSAYAHQAPGFTHAQQAAGRGRPTRTVPYNTGPGSAYHLLFGDQQQSIPDLNVVPGLNVEEVVLSQSAPNPDDV